MVFPLITYAGSSCVGDSGTTSCMFDSGTELEDAMDVEEVLGF
jgi:hypothetical protein